MSRLTIDFTVANAGSGNRMSAIPGALVTVFYRNSDGTEGGVAPVYEFGDPTILTTLSQPLGSDGQGRIPGWLDPGDYVISVTASGYTSYSTAYTVPSGASMPLVIQDPSGSAMPIEPIIQFAGSNVTVVDDPTNTRTVITPTGGSMVHKFSFAFDTTGLVTGVTVAFTDGYVPAVGDLLLDFWFQIDTAWDGTTPKGDFGASTITRGLLSDWGAGAADMTLRDPFNQGGNGLQLSDFTKNSFSSSMASTGRWQGRFVEAVSWVVYVSTTGRGTGADPGSTQGAATLYLETATPV